MIYRKYGKTDMKVSAIGFGGMRFEDQEDVDTCASLVKACYDAGINYFDTASGYGKSEELLGVAFKEMKKTRAEKPFYVSTKTFGTETKTIRKDLETSLERMAIGMSRSCRLSSNSLIPGYGFVVSSQRLAYSATAAAKHSAIVSSSS